MNRNPETARTDKCKHAHQVSEVSHERLLECEASVMYSDFHQVSLGNPFVGQLLLQTDQKKRFYVAYCISRLAAWQIGILLHIFF